MTRRRLGLLFAAQGVATGFLLPFLVALLDERGIDPAGIGLVLGLAAAVAAGAYPAWGYLADARVGRSRVLVVASLLGAVAGLALAVGPTEPLATAIAVSVISIGTSAWGPVSDAVALRSLGADAGDYGRIRRWTSVGWIGATLVGGAVYASIGPALLPAGFALGALGVGAASLGLRSDPAGPDDGRTAGRAAGDDGTATGLRDFLGLARRSPVLGPFLLGLFIVSAGSGAAASFLPLRIVDTGGGPVVIAAASALAALVEIPFFSASGRIAARIGLRGLYAIGIAVCVAQFLVVAVAPGPLVIAAARTIDGGAYALRYTAIVLVVGAALPERLRAMGQSSTWLVTGAIAPIVGGPVGGALYALTGGPAFFVGSAVLITVGATIAISALRGAPFRAARATAPVEGSAG